MKERRKTSAAEFNAERPYERMDAMGADKLTDAELIAILIHSGDGSGDATAISRRLLNGNNPQNPPSLGILCGMSFKDLMKIRGIGKVKARRILALMELSIRLAQVRHEKGLIFKHFFKLVVGQKILQQGEQIFIPAVRIKHLFQPADSLCDRLKFSFAQALLLQINILKFNAALFEKAFRFTGVGVFLCSEYLNIHII